MLSVPSCQIYAWSEVHLFLRTTALSVGFLSGLNDQCRFCKRSTLISNGSSIASFKSGSEHLHPLLSKPLSLCRRFHYNRHWSQTHKRKFMRHIGEWIDRTIRENVYRPSNDLKTVVLRLTCTTDPPVPLMIATSPTWSGFQISETAH